MNADKLIRSLAGLAVLAVAAIAAVASFVHVERLALTHGQDQLAAALTPLSIDGTILAASMVMLFAARNARPIPLLARFMLAVAVAATVLANIAFGAAYGLTGALISGWPALAFTGCVELAVWMSRSARVSTVGTVSDPASEHSPASASEPASADAPDGNGRVQPKPASGPASKRRPRKPVTEATAQAHFRADLEGGQVPSARRIQTSLRVGQPRAKELRRHLEQVATSNGHRSEGPLSDSH